MFEHISTTTQKLTPRIIEEFAEMKPCAGERKFSKQRAKFLRSKIENGEFHPPRWSFVWMNGEKYRANGQHSSKVLSQLNGHIPKDMEVIIDEFRAESPEDLPYLFSQFDPRSSTRTQPDVLGAHAGIHAELANVNHSAMARIVYAIGWSMSHRGIRKFPAVDDRARLIHEFPEYIQWAEPFAKAREIGKWIGVLAAVFDTYRSDASAAQEFWTFVKDGSQSNPNDPTRLLNTLLSEYVNVKKQDVPFGSEGFYVKSIHAWNAWRADRSINRLKYHRKSPLPAVA